MPSNKLQLTRIDELALKNGLPQEVIIDAVTQLGRAGKCVATSPGCTPDMLEDAKIAIQIEDPTNLLSRNHALIYPPTTNSDPFMIKDLGSKNGTFVNDRPVEKGKKAPFYSDDIIRLSGGAVFKVKILGINAYSCYGLMVGHHGGNLNGTTGDVRDLKTEFQKRGFEITELIDLNATRDRILKVLADYKGRVTGDSIFLFHFSGHGTRRGELCLGGGFFDNKKLSAEELFGAFEGYRGQILIILDGCYTDSFAEADIPPRSVLIGHAGKAYEGVAPSVIHEENNYGGGNIVRGHTSRAMTKALKSNPGRVNVQKLYEAVKDDPRILARQQEVELHPQTIIFLPSIKFGT